MITAKKNDGTTEKTLIFIVREITESFSVKLRLLLKTLEDSDAW
jgi:hypothetical protein